MLTAFEAYGSIARKIDDEVLCSGRSAAQAYCIPYIVSDIINKLEITKVDEIFDIGCGTGLIAAELSKHVNIYHANDNEDVIQKFLTLHPSEAAKIHFLSGNFLSMNLDINVEKILAYSVIHYMKNEQEVFAFIDKALSLLKPGGKLLIGDIPNISHKQRFLETEFGATFSKKYTNRANLSETDEKKRDEVFNNAVRTISSFSDEFLLNLIGTYRKMGYAAYILPQNGQYNAFGYTREDILISKYY